MGLNASLAQHGYSILAAIVFLEGIGVPVPAAVALLIVGGGIARGRCATRGNGSSSGV